MHVPAGNAQAAQAASAASNDFEDFIYLISHDVRNSVRALIELPQWIEEDLQAAGIKLNGDVRDSFDLMHRHTGRLDRMLVDLLAFSRIGRMQTVTSIDLDEALTDVLEQMKTPPSFEVVRGFDCPNLMIGETDVMTLLTALISNAVKHHDKEAGKIVVSSRRDGDEVVLRVSDDGPGISEEFHEKVFGAMTTLRPRDEIEGSGMGLALVRKVADLYHGSVSVCPSRARRGTTIEVRFPGHKRGSSTPFD